MDHWYKVDTSFVPSSCLCVFVVNLCYAGAPRRADELGWEVGTGDKQIKIHLEATKILNHAALSDDTEQVAAQIVDAAFKAMPSC